MNDYPPRFRMLEAAEDDHSASRRLDVLELTAPHLIARARPAAVNVRETAELLHLAVETGRRDRAESGHVREELWTLMDRLAGELTERLGELELERRR